MKWPACGWLSRWCRRWWLAGLVFAVFRVLDIVKPSIIGWCDRSLKGGLGVMADDLVAGLGAGLTGALIALFI